MYKNFYEKLKNFYEAYDTIKEAAEIEKYWLSDFSFKTSIFVVAYDLSCNLIKSLRVKASKVYVEVRSVV